MTTDLLASVQLVSILLGALGAPSLTYWALKRLNQEIQRHLLENCDACRARLQESIQRLEDDLKVVESRQIKLRESLPLEYVRRDEYLRHLNGKPV